MMSDFDEDSVSEHLGVDDSAANGYSSGFELHYERFNSGEARLIASDLLHRYYEWGLRGRTVVDLCCGTGDVVHAFAAEGNPTIGVDGSPGMLSLAASKVSALPCASLLRRDVRHFRERSDAGLVTCLNGSVNQMLDDDLLRLLYESIGFTLARDGYAVMDLYSREYMSTVDHALLIQDDDDVVCFLKSISLPSGHVHIQLTGAIRDSTDEWVRFRQTISQRYISPEQATAGLRAAGLSADVFEMESAMSDRFFVVARPAA